MNIPSALGALFAQIAAYVLALVMLPALFERLWHPSLFQLALIEGFFAALFSMKLEKWWVPIQLLFFPMIVFVSTFQLDPNLFLLGFFLLGVIYWNACGKRVPLYLSGSGALKEISNRLPEGGFHFADLGSGLGSVISRLAREKPDGKFFGIESAPLPYLVGKARCAGLSNCAMKWGKYEKVDLSSFDFVYAYLSPVPMPALFEKAKREMKPGSLLISNSFAVPETDPDEIVEAGGKMLYFWKM